MEADPLDHRIAKGSPEASGIIPGGQLHWWYTSPDGVTWTRRNPDKQPALARKEVQARPTARTI